MPLQTFVLPALRRLCGDRAMPMKAKIAALYGGLVVANLVAWAWALLAFHDNSVLLGAALLAYGFGLRHAVDADHIAAIDNVTRKLMAEGKRPIGVGLFFALGHSTVVVGAALVVALTAATLQSRHPGLVAAGGAIGTAISAVFLFAVALINLAVLVGVFKLLRRVRRGGHYHDDDLSSFLARRGITGRLFRRLFRLITRSRHMYLLGFLFALGFDTATEIGLLGISAAEAARGVSAWSILAFPALFTAGMSLVDTTDGVIMLGAYGWAFVNPVRKLYYNLTITGISVVVAIVVGGIEALGLVAGRFGLTGGVWNAIGAANNNFGVIGYAVIAVFVMSWIISLAVYRLMGYDKLGARGGN